MNWINTKEQLPKEGKYVLARHCRGTWYDSDDQDNVNCVVVKLVKGISAKEREEMRAGNLPNPIICLSRSSAPRSSIYKRGDEHGNNLVNYEWDTFGTDSFFGQTITHWTPIEPLN